VVEDVRALEVVLTVVDGGGAWKVSGSGLSIESLGGVW